jgi:hopene-associated glycosyltransferase HpnB
MTWIVSALAFAALAAWLGQLTLRHGFWRADQRLSPEAATLSQWPAVTAVIPARDEAGVVGRAVASLLSQDYPGTLSIVLVDDCSEDGTSARARETAERLGASARLTIVEGMPLPTGWTGKLWAVEQGMRRAATQIDATYLLLTDADIEHDPSTLRRLVAKAASEHLDLVSLMVLLNCRSFWERLLIPAFVFFFQMLYPFPLVNLRSASVAAAAGGCMLVRRDALERAGGISAIRGAIIDDCALARLLKSQGGAIWLGLAESTRSLREYATLGEIWRMVARSAYTQLKRSPLLLLGTVAALAVVYIAPPVLAIAGPLSGHPAAGAAAFAAWAAMAFAYRPTTALYAEPRWRTLLLPVAAALYTAMTIDSALDHWRGRGGAWKGRHYARSLDPAA